MSRRAIVIAVVLSIISIAWIHQSSLVQTPGLRFAPVYIASVPPVPALMFLVALMAVRPLLRRIPGLSALSRKELLVVYAFLVIAIPPVTFGIVSLMLPWITVPTYFDTPQMETAELVADLPDWYGPTDTEAIRQMYEGTDEGVVPWATWVRPLGVWTVFLMLLYATGLCAVTLFRKQWSENERLRYPLLLIPLDLTAETTETDTAQAVRGFFRDPLVWVAVGLVFLHHALNVANAFNPAVTALGERFSLAGLFTEAPWTSFQRLSIFHRPQIVGFAWFVSLDVLFSVWFFHLLDPLAQSFSQIFGLGVRPGWPYMQQQGIGAFLMLFVVLGWTARGHLTEMAAGAIGRARQDFSGEPMAPAWSFWGTIAGFAAIIVWMVITGMSVLPAIAYFGMTLAFGLVYARIRAETGVPTMWAYPFSQARNAMFYTMGGEGLLSPNRGNLLGVAGFAWIGRGFFTSMMGYQLENEKLAEEGDLSRRGMVWVILGAFLLGLVVAYAINLQSYYAYGANVLQGGTTGGGYSVQTAVSEWSQAAATVSNPTAPDWGRMQGALAGAIITLGLVLARFHFLRSPFHPIGYAMTLNYGYALWGPFLGVWLTKAIVHRIGGARAFRRGMPFFLGLAFGDLFIGGLSWIAMAIFGPEIFQGYMVQFG